MAVEISASPSAMAQLQSVQKAMALPTVSVAVEHVEAIYSRVKGAHSLLQWALSTAEAGVSLAASSAAPYVAAPLADADARVAAALTELERRVPLVAEQPKVIVETTKQAVLARVSPHVNKVMVAGVAAQHRVKSLKELSWARANALLSSSYGQKALRSVDMGAACAQRLLDQYLPPAEQEPPADEVACETTPAQRTAHAVRRLSAVAARRLWAELARRLQQLSQSGIELDVRRYIAALFAAVQLAYVTRLQHHEAEGQQQHNAESQQQETTEQQQQPAPHSQPSTNHQATPPQPETSSTTAKKVKTTPEGKSNVLKPEDSDQ